MQKRWLLAILPLLFTTLEARIAFDQAEPAPNGPWFTGPLLCPSGHVVAEGHQNYEPYLYWIQENGVYDKHWAPHTTPNYTSVLLQGAFQFGILPGTEFDVAPQFYYNYTKHASDWRVGDLPVTLAFQLLKDTKEVWYPAVKLRIAANVPIGKYDRLAAKKEQTDVGGNGNWAPSVGLVLVRTVHFTGEHYLSIRYFLSNTFTVPVHVHGLSAYGGTTHTHGRVYPGNKTTTILAFEYSMTQSWALALDMDYTYQCKTRFSGHSGGVAPKSPSSTQFSLAPAIEYNWSANLGVIAGGWFTAFGRNTSRFGGGIVAVNIYH